MAARNRRKNNKKKSLLVTSAAQEKNATYVLVAEELHKNTIDLNMGTETPLTENHENPIPAKEFKHQQKLEPIDEHDDGEDELSIKFKSMTKSSGPITEADAVMMKLLPCFSHCFCSHIMCLHKQWTFMILYNFDSNGVVSLLFLDAL